MSKPLCLLCLPVLFSDHCLGGGESLFDHVLRDLQGPRQPFQCRPALATGDMSIAQGIYPACGFGRVLVAKAETKGLRIQP